MNSATLYRVFDIVVETNICFPELPRAHREPPACKFELLPAKDASEDQFDWFDQWQIQDLGPWLNFAIHDGRYLLRFPDQGDYWVSFDGKEVQCSPSPQAPNFAIRHLFLNQVLPLILSRQERLVVHASAVVFAQGAAAFVGRSGQGKSTIAATFGAMGCSVLADDCLVLRDSPGGWMGIPSYPGVRLSPEGSEEVFGSSPVEEGISSDDFKRRISDPAMLRFAEKPSAVRCLYFIDGDEEAGQTRASITRLAPNEAFIKLCNHSFNINIKDKRLLRRQFASIAAITATVPCFDLNYPRVFSSLDGLRDAIVDHQSREAANFDLDGLLPKIANRLFSTSQEM
jgi:hypothetical protein